MGLNETPSSERITISFFGRRNAGKSSLVNAVTGQELSVVSDIKGTTTDPVRKAMELLPIGPVVIIDTPGFDDEGELGEKRVRKTQQILNRTDIAVLAVDAAEGIQNPDRQLIELFSRKNIPYLIVFNKTDLLSAERTDNSIENSSEKSLPEQNILYTSASGKTGIYELKEALAGLYRKNIQSGEARRLVGDLLTPGDVIVLVIPIDESAPKGRLILPQQMVIRDALDVGAIPVCCKETELEETLGKLTAPPKMVITDSQAFAYVSKVVPEQVPLTSFSILMAKYKGFLREAVLGTAALSKIKDGDRILISEGCTHHRQCGDIGTVKLPKLLRKFTASDFVFDTSSGGSFPDRLSRYSVVIHCGGCMLNEKEMLYRMKCAQDAGVPFTNYGTALAQMNGILHRSLSVLPDVQQLLYEENKTNE